MKVQRLRRLRDLRFRQGRQGEALELARTVARRDPGRESFFRLGVVYRETGRYTQAIRAFRNALRFRSGPRHLLAEIHLHKAFTWHLLGDRDQMRRSLARAVAMRPKPRSDANLHLMLGHDHRARGRLAEALREFAAAESVARTPLLRGRAAHNQGVIALSMGDVTAAGRHLDRALRAHRASGRWGDYARVLVDKSGVHFDSNEPGRALRLLERAAGFAARARNLDLQGVALQNGGYVAATMGRWSTARRLLDRALPAAEACGDVRTVVRTYATRAMVLAESGETGRAEADLARARSRARGIDCPVASLFLARGEAHLSRARQDWVRLRRSARLGERIASRLGDSLRLAEFRALRAEGELGLGRLRAARLAQRSSLQLLEIHPPKRNPFWIRVQKIASSPLSLLILGEAGTGKTGIASEIHRLSSRSSGPCVLVRCENLPFPQDELYGHVRGAWSGAEQDAIGAARRAHGGTLILDRLDDLSAESQRVLVPVLEGRIRPVGSEVEHRVDVRIVATAVKDEKIIPALRRRFAAEIRMPPLRERREEIRGWVDRFLAGRRRITHDALATLARHRWEGNLPELRAVVERLVERSRGTIGRHMVQKYVYNRSQASLAVLVYGTRTSRLAPLNPL